ncbi:type II secretion system protein [Bacillus sp. BRMEA1]|uniref:type II secretion system protein n=1 Tax=Neobacillus endophyticus TaxID=2738405 RepID=UPI001567996E|nr:type II secretion system protein [Neobacillus endophyticus]NRD76002.1 type II secretion system protein [Neobacillus endophyticus]
MLKKARDQKGMTLIELLAVVVILGIISAIAIPSILGLIDNSKKDAHIANARQMIDAAKRVISSERTAMPSAGNSKIIPLQYFENGGYLETVKDPDGNNSSYTTKGTSISDLTGTDVSKAPTNDSYVLIVNPSNGSLVYYVRLVNSARGIQTESKAPVAESDLSRDNIH